MVPMRQRPSMPNIKVAHLAFDAALIPASATAHAAPVRDHESLKVHEYLRNLSI